MRFRDRMLILGLASLSTLFALAHVPADRYPPPLLEVWLNPTTGEYCCGPGSQIVLEGTHDRIRRSGFSVRSTYRDVSRNPELRPTKDCEEARCFILRYSLLETIFDKLWGYRLQEKWLRFDDEDESVGWLFRYHRPDGSALMVDGSEYEVVDDPDGWFK